MHTQFQRQLCRRLNWVLFFFSMQLIRCTKKLQKEIGIKSIDLVTLNPGFSFLGQWHANLIYINGKKCVLFANDRTLLNFISPDVSRAQIRDLGNIFRTWLAAVLHREGLEPALVQQILTEYEEVGIAKSKNRSVLGSLNDLAFHYEFLIQESGGLHSPEIPDIIYKLNRMPMSPLKLAFPDKELRAIRSSIH